jgi:hypothetical protein
LSDDGAFMCAVRLGLVAMGLAVDAALLEGALTAEPRATAGMFVA